METRANFVLVGAFTLAVAVAALAFVFWFAGVGRFSDQLSYQIVFKGSVSGLSRGSVVLFNGVKVGEVQLISFLPNDPSQVAATAVVANGTPIRSDTKARLELQGLTGSAAIALTGGAFDALPLKAVGGFAGSITAEPSQLQNILENVQALTTKADKALTRVNDLLDANSGNVSQIVANVADLTKSLSQDGSGISGALKSIADLSNSLGPTAQGLQKTMARVDALVAAVDAGQVKDIVGNADKFSKALGDNAEGVDKLMGQLGGIAKSLDPVIAGAKDLVAALNKMSDAIDVKKVGSVIDNVQAFSQTLADAKPQVQSITSDLAGLSKTLNGSSAVIAKSFTDLDATLKSLDPVVAGAKDLVTSANGIAAAIDPKKVAGAIDNIQGVSQTLADAGPQVRSMVGDLSAFSKAVNGSSAAITGSFTDLDASLKALDPKKLASIADGFASFADALKENRGNVDAFLKDSADLTKKLNGSADKLDGLVTSIAGLTGGSGDGKNAIAEVGAAASSLRILADQVSARVKEIAPGLTRFSNSGLREYEALAADGRKAVNDVDRVVKGFERNPSQLIFGAKPGLPEYHGAQ